MNDLLRSNLKTRAPPPPNHNVWILTRIWLPKTATQRPTHQVPCFTPQTNLVEKNQLRLSSPRALHLLNQQVMEGKPFPMLGKPSNLELPNPHWWAIFIQGKIMELSDVIIKQIKADPTHIWVWFDQHCMEAWRHIFLFTPISLRLGHLPLTDPAW